MTDRYTVEQVAEGLPEIEVEAEPSSDARGNGGDPEPNWFEQYGASQAKSGATARTPAEEAKLRSALDAIPTDEEILNEELGDSHMVWVNVGRALHRLGWGERGKAIWRDWSRRNVDKFDEKGLNTQWRSFGRTRDSGKKKVTVGTVYHYARTFGWRYHDEERAEAEPTYIDDATTGAARARAELEQLIEAFLDAEPNWWEKYSGITRYVHAVQATTGIGKTQIAARVIARRIRTGRLIGPVGYAVPTHRLGEDIAEQFRAHGITAAVWRGRKAFISGKSGPTMCDDLAAVKIAKDMGAVIETACCSGKDPAGKKVTCPHYHTCAYQAQKARTPDVWLIAHQMLFRKNKTLDGMSALFVDESFRDAGTSKPVKGLTIDEIEAVPPNAGELEIYTASCWRTRCGSSRATAACRAGTSTLVSMPTPARAPSSWSGARRRSRRYGRGCRRRSAQPQPRPAPTRGTSAPSTGCGALSASSSSRARRTPSPAGCSWRTTRPRAGSCASCGRAASARSRSSTWCPPSSWTRRCQRSRSSRGGSQTLKLSVR
jgi:hypothetical protein